MRWSEQDLEHYLRRGQPAPISEAVFQRAVMQLARQYGWTFAYHTYRSTKSMGGFPDLVLARPSMPNRPQGTLVFAELKTDTGIVSQAQAAWLEALAGCTGVVSEVWRPKDLEKIVEKLRDI